MRPPRSTLNDFNPRSLKLTITRRMLDGTVSVLQLQHRIILGDEDHVDDDDCDEKGR